MKALEYTSKELATALAFKGYEQTYIFFSENFDFIDRLIPGLNRVEELLVTHTAESSFSLSGFPIWNGEDQPRVSSYISCTFREGRFSLSSFELTYKDGFAIIEDHIQKEPTMGSIPNRAEIHRKLNRLINPSRTNKKGIKKYVR